MSQLMIQEATLQDEAELLCMMRRLAEQEPGKIQFDEPTARATFRRFLSLPAFGKVGFSVKGTSRSATLC